MEHESGAIFIDSSVLISCGRRESTRFRALAREARQRDTVFRISPRVYAEVTGDSAPDAYTSSGSPVEVAVQEGWVNCLGVKPRGLSVDSRSNRAIRQACNHRSRSTSLT